LSCKDLPHTYTQGLSSFLLLLLIILPGLGSTACDNPENPKPTTYTINFDTNGGSEVAPITRNEGTAIAKPTDPTRDGYVFTGWFSTETGGTEYEWPHTLTVSITMYGQWQDVPNLNAESGNRQIVLTWINPADEDFDHVEITITPPVGNGEIIAPDRGVQSLTVTDLINKTEYTFTLVLVNTEGNKSDGTTKTATPLDPVVVIAEYLAAASGGNSADNPVPLEAAFNLTTYWQKVLSAIQTEGKYVSLDLTACAMANMTDTTGEFDPGAANTGENLIVSLVLPDAATKIVYSSPGAFRYFTSLKTVKGSAVTTISYYAFSGCAALTTADFPLVTSISNGAFSGCAALTTANFPLVTSIGDRAFSDCAALTTADFPLVTSLGDRAFSGCAALTTADFPLVTSLGNDAFSGCAALTTADFPLVETIGDRAFERCTALITANFPQGTSIGGDVFLDTGDKALVITLPQNAPTVPILSSSTSDVVYAKTVTIKTPAGSTGYDAAWESLFEAGFGAQASITLSFADLK
jgi:uncharacterized repeat protein (TIGR02543 family)